MSLHNNLNKLLDKSIYIEIYYNDISNKWECRFINFCMSRSDFMIGSGDYAHEALQKFVSTLMRLEIETSMENQQGDE